MAKLTEKAILKTFDEMIREMPFDKITVTSLVERCGISSNTFYYHYQDIYALLELYLEIKIARDARKDYPVKDWKTILKELIHKLQEDSAVIYHIFQSMSKERLKRYVFYVLEKDVELAVQNRIGEAFISEEKQQMLSGAFCYSLCGFVLKFIFDGMNTDVDKTFDPIIDFLEYGIAKYIERETNNNEK